MNQILAAVVVLGSLFGGRASATEPPLDPGPVLRGTINVIAANDQGIVVLTDSMLSQKVPDGHGGWTYQQVADPGQKLFQIDDHTVCTFAGFASVKTPAVPDFLNNVSAIMGRYEGYLRGSRATTIAEKLEQLEVVFDYYLRLTAEMLNAAGSESDYYVELLIAGYDPDGTPKVGSLILNMHLETNLSGDTRFVPVTVQRQVIPVPVGQGFFVIHGKRELAMRILRQPTLWTSDPAIATYALGKPLTIEQMKLLAISLKQHTSEIDPTVGGPNQIAVLTGGHVRSVEQPSFPPITATGFKFRIVEDDDLDNSGLPAGRTGYGVFVSPGYFTLYFKNSFKRVEQWLDEAYFSGNVFRECRLLYNGGRLRFENSNEVYDSDLILGGVNRDTPEVKHLLKDFKWRHVVGLAEASNSPSTEDRSKRAEGK
jgi:hypothetical protein